MTNRPQRKCEFLLLRYVPDAVREEFVNFGVVLYTTDAGPSFGDVLLAKNWKRVRCLDPDVDLDVLTGLEQDIREKLREPQEWGKLMAQIESSFSGVIQVTQGKPILTESPVEELEKLREAYVLSPRSGPRTISGRQEILQTMRREFERQGVTQFLQHSVSAAQYTYAGDPLKIDYSYRPNGTVKMFQAVAIESDVTAAKALAFSYPRLRDGIRAKENAGLEMTAVVESDLDGENEGVRFARRVLDEQGIRVRHTADLPWIAAGIREALKL